MSSCRTASSSRSTSSAVADGFNPVAVQAFTYDGKTYGLPYAIENIALVRNTDLVPEAPATFEEMMQIATDYKAAHADDPTALGLAVQIGAAGRRYHLQPFLSAFGGYIFAQNADGTYNPDDVGIDSAGGLATASWLQEQAAAGLLSADVTYDTMIVGVRLGQGAVRRHRPVGDQPGRQRLQGDRRALRRRADPADGGRRHTATVRRRAGLHGVVVLRAARTWPRASCSTT